MMKYLLIAALIAVVYYLWRAQKVRAERAAAPPPRPHATGGPQDMVSCPVCGLHLPRDEALAGASGRLYCGPDHRRLGGN